MDIDGRDIHVLVRLVDINGNPIYLDKLLETR